MPVLETAPRSDIFADPFDEDETAAARPALLILDDGGESPPVREARGRLLAAAESSGIRVDTIRATEGPDVGRFAALLATGRFAAAYLGLGLGTDRASQPGARGLGG